MLTTTPRVFLSAVIASALVVGAATGAVAHFITADEAVAAIKKGALGAGLELLSVAPHNELPRMLVVRVGADWPQHGPALRLRLAAEWRALWREATNQGLVAIVDEAGTSLVSFDGNGAVQLRE